MIRAIRKKIRGVVDFEAYSYGKVCAENVRVGGGNSSVSRLLIILTFLHVCARALDRSHILTPPQLLCLCDRRLF